MFRTCSPSIAPVVLATALISGLTTSRSDAAPVLSFGSDCNQAANSLVAVDSASPLGLTVGGTVDATLTAEGSCTATWTAETVVDLAAGFYAVGGDVDFDYLIDAVLFGGDTFGLAFLSWDISQSLVGTPANLAIADTIFWVTPAQSGHVSIQADSSILDGVYELAAGEYTLQQTATLTLNLIGGQFFIAALDFPATAYVIPMPAPEVPEPASILMLGGGLAALAARRRRPGTDRC
jgi:hypothetical protein